MKKPKFVLTKKNQKGQVAIFVALIFQVIFVFFALLINVGLLVHHKINLQQSVDLAAYYGAMKQAESLNAIGHINFQIRQAWKLLTWRYRVLGTFGFQGGNAAPTPPGSPVFPEFPLNINTIPATVNGSLANQPSTKCLIGGDRVSTADIPFFCIGHVGMLGWKGADENNCKISCGQIAENASSISKIPSVGTSITPFGGSVAGSVNSAINTANLNLQTQCEALGPKGMDMLARFIASYYLEETARSKTLLMLAANLSKDDPEKILDLDGNLVLDGVKKTLKYNLTEANASSLNDSKIKILNGLSDPNCKLSKNPADIASKKANDTQFLKRIEFSFVQFYMYACSWDGTRANYVPGTIFDPTGTGILGALKANANLSSLIMSLEGADNQKFSVGYEKNPWCESYYSVKAESEPKIPFLPLSKIKLTALAVAKPFGGSVGPWFGKEWASDAKNSQVAVGTDPAKQTDSNLPLINAFSGTTMKDNAKITLNFSRFIGDDKGLSDAAYLGEYHAALLNRQPTNKLVSSLGSSKTSDGGIGKLSTPQVWPAFASWNNVILDIGTNGYDPLAMDAGHDSYLRDLEISAIAPNQFDLAYYSIDPDFYNNYYLRISDPTIFNKIKSSAGFGPDDEKNVLPDFGNNASVYTNKKSFSVRNQIEIVEKVFRGTSTGLKNSASDFLTVYPELATRQASLLTGWTFFNLSDFNKFPDSDISTPDGTMSFGRCRDDWQNDGGSPDYKTPMEVNSALPPTPGNCVTGGRVGYSVKLVSPSMLRSNAPPQPLGGPNTSGPILNPIPDSFLTF